MVAHNGISGGGEVGADLVARAALDIDFEQGDGFGAMGEFEVFYQGGAGFAGKGGQGLRDGVAARVGVIFGQGAGFDARVHVQGAGEFQRVRHCAVHQGVVGFVNESGGFPILVLLDHVLGKSDEDYAGGEQVQAV